jgi:hypothetical protein
MRHRASLVLSSSVAEFYTVAHCADCSLVPTGCIAFLRPYPMRVCCMRHKSTGARCTVVAAAIPTADIRNLEDYDMHRTHRYIASLFLTAALVAPVSTMAVPVPQEARDQNRVYDKDHKDYHNWDDNENRAWGQFLTEKPQKFARILEGEQEGAVAILELAPCSSRQKLARSPHRPWGSLLGCL